LLNWVVLLLQNVGEIAAIIIWAVISLAILAVAWVITKLTGVAGSGIQPPFKN